MGPVPLADVSRQHDALRVELEAALRRVLASGWFVMGSEHAGFEREFAGFCGRRHALGVANGTDALELALRAVGVGPGDRVATVANAGGYTSTAALALGATPVHVDIDAGLTLDPMDLARALDEGHDLKAVVVTHLYGRLADVAGIRRVLADRPIALIEDCAQAHGAARGGVRAGGWGDLATFSFYPTKNLGALGDGGAVVTDRDELADRVTRLRQYGWTARYENDLAGGRNSRLDEIQAAALRVKLPHLDAWNAERGRIAERVRRAALAIGATIPPPIESGADVAHLCVVRFRDRDRVRQRLGEQGIQTAIHYPRLDPEQPAFRAALARGARPLPVSLAARDEILTLPCFPGMTAAEVDRVCEALAACGAA